jgi:Ser-tRNA(Ala) deacylase AlaX
VTDLLFHADTYLREAKTRIRAHTPEGGLVPEASLFYARGGGQPGDRGLLV